MLTWCSIEQQHRAESSCSSPSLVSFHSHTPGSSTREQLRSCHSRTPSCSMKLKLSLCWKCFSPLLLIKNNNNLKKKSETSLWVEGKGCIKLNHVPAWSCVIFGLMELLFTHFKQTFLPLPFGIHHIDLKRGDRTRGNALN